MSDGIFIVKDDGTLVPMRPSPFESEAVLQQLLASHPSLLVGEAVNPTNPRRWLLIARELGVPDEEGGADRWSLDHLFVDQDGVPTLVEVKRASDPRARREVVAQMLDYAANSVVYWPVERMRQRFEHTCAGENRDPEEALKVLLSDPEAQPDAFWGQVDLNLRAGRIRMVFVADIIHPELKRIVEFLNKQMSPADVLAIELRHYTGQGLRTLVPRVIGLTAEAEQRKSGTAKSRPNSGPRLSIEEWVAKFETDRGADELALAYVVRDWWAERGAIFGVNRDWKPALFAQIERNGSIGKPAAIKSDGRVSTGLYALKSLPPYNQESMRREALASLSEISGMVFSERSFDGEPALPLALLNDQKVRHQLFSVWSTLLDRIEAGS